MRVFIIPMRVRSMDNSIMPKGASSAYVSCFSTGNDFMEASEKALESLVNDGIHSEEILQPIYEMDSNEWSHFISEQWPEQKSSLITQTEFENAMKKGEVVYGPFGLYTESL